MAKSAPSDVRIFVLDLGQHARLLAQLFRRILLAGLLVLACFQVLWWWASLGNPHAPSLGLSVLTLLALLAFLGVFNWLWLWLLFSRYRLLLAPGYVAADGSGRLEHRVDRERFEHLCEVPMGLVLVQGSGLPLRIPRSLKGYDEVRQALLAWRPLTLVGQPGYRPWLGLVGKLAMLIASVVMVASCALLLGVANVLASFVMAMP